MRIPLNVRHCLRRRYGTSSSSTVNASEIAHFSRLSSQWWDEHGEFAFLHKMNPVRMQFIQEKVLEIEREEKGEDVLFARGRRKRSILEGMDILDVGCGGGLLSESLARLGARTLGIDASKSNISIASLHARTDPMFTSPESNLAYKETTVEAILSEGPAKQFDVVCSMEVLEHVDNPADFLSSCAQLVRPGGHLFLSTVARTPLSYVLTILAAEYVLRKVTPGTHTFSKFVNPNELVDFFRNYSVDTEKEWISPPLDSSFSDLALRRTEAEVRGLVYNPFQARWVLMSRVATSWGAAKSSYLFWVRRPLI